MSLVLKFKYLFILVLNFLSWSSSIVLKGKYIYIYIYISRLSIFGLDLLCTFLSISFLIPVSADDNGIVYRQGLQRDQA